ncbi:MAG: FAD:protein FMN transferase [Firmicutes bacterium]|nr:FAD:protein FMN transferase [Bacillota bacterium]
MNNTQNEQLNNGTKRTIANRTFTNRTTAKHTLARRAFIKCAAILLIALMIIPQAGCQKKKDPTPLWDEGYYLDSVCRITLYATDDELKMSVAKPILNEAMDIIARYERFLSKTKEGSDIWKINHSEGKPVECDKETVNVLWEAIEYCSMTNGAFDITIGGVVDLWDFSGVSGIPKVPTSAELSRALKHVDYRKISIEGNTVTLLDPQAQIDLGAIAKGFIAEKVGQYLRSRGVTGAVIDFGGNLEIIGYKAGWVPLNSEVEEKGDVDGDGVQETVGGIAGGKPFIIGIKKPYGEGDEIIGTLTTANSSVVTSSVCEEYFEANGKTYHHILSSKTGYPVNSGLVSVTVVGPTNTSSTCDAFSTICLLLGRDAATEFMAAYPEYGVIFIDTEGEVTTIGPSLDFKLVDSGEDADLTEEGIKVD